MKSTHERDPLPRGGRRRAGAQLVDVAERRVDLSVARHRVAAVGVALRGEEQRHQVQVGEPEFLEIRDSVAHAVEVARKAVDVTDAAEHRARLEPVGIPHPILIQGAEVGRAFRPRLHYLREERVELGMGIRSLAVDGEEQIAQPRRLSPESLFESLGRNRSGCPLPELGDVVIVVRHPESLGGSPVPVAPTIARPAYARGMTSAPTTASTSTVEFWFDPTCPWAWMASRWVDEVAEHRDLDVTWNVMSLAVLNEDKDVDDDHRERLPRALRYVKLITAVREARRPGEGQGPLRRARNPHPPAAVRRRRRRDRGVARGVGAPSGVRGPRRRRQLHGADARIALRRHRAGRVRMSAPRHRDRRRRVLRARHLARAEGEDASALWDGIVAWRRPTPASSS